MGEHIDHFDTNLLKRPFFNEDYPMLHQSRGGAKKGGLLSAHHSRIVDLIERGLQSLDKFQENIPSQFSSVVAKPTQWNEFCVGGGGNLNVNWALSCRCGQKSVRALGTYSPQVRWDETLCLTSPYWISCPACRSIETIFDIGRDGFGAHMNGWWPNIDILSHNGAGRRRFACAACAHEEFELIARLQYHPSSFLEETLEDRPRVSKQDAPNIFTWFTLIANCQACGEINVVAENKCC